MRMRVAVVGLGKISEVYLRNITARFHGIRLYGVYDIDGRRMAQAQAAYPQVKPFGSLQDALDDSQVDTILNLTRPADHFAINKRALAAGKHVYTEKPLALSAAQAAELVDLAKANGVTLCAAPDTILGQGMACCEQAVRGGVIGTPIGYAAAMLCPGHERWHPDPQFYYQAGGGPLMDMGPYYLSALVLLLGRVEKVVCRDQTTFAERCVLRGPRAGETFAVDVPTHMTALLCHESGVTGTLCMSFDVHYPTQARFDVYGTKGTLLAPDPNTFGGPVSVFDAQNGARVLLPQTQDADNMRGAGLDELRAYLENGTIPKTHASNALHTMAVIAALKQSAASGGWICVE